MRLRAGLILFFLLILIPVVGGCRKPLAPTFDRNQAPETWITAAPLDTITLRDGPTPIQTEPGVIPFRYHLYWAGSDPDGKIAGFFFAVVETLPIPIPPATVPPPLPGPKARDYHFTTKTDSTFIFSVSDARTDRRHAFYIYAVDNLGKPDPTPAKFIFNSIDRYPPLAVIDKFITTGFVWNQDPTTLALTRVLRSDTVTAQDTFKIGAIARKTVPVGSRIDIAWHSEATTVDNPAVGYRYKLDEPDYVSVGVSTTTLSYNTGPGDAVGPGLKLFRLRAIDQAGGARSGGNTPETNRFFQMNFPPVTWIAGADVANPIWTQAPPAGPGPNGRERYITVASWAGGIPRGTNGQPIDLTNISLLSSDSVKIMPSQRIPRRNFLEIFREPGSTTRDRIYVRSEGDTVNMNSWAIFFSGGYDADSPYSVVYRSNDPNAPDSTNNPVLQIRPASGSPVGFRSRIPAYLWPSATPTIPSQTGLYPLFDPSSTFRATYIGAYWQMSQAGTAYFFARAEDGNGQLDARIGADASTDPRTIANAVDSLGSATPLQLALRPLIMRFFVDKAPTMSLTPAAVHPKPNETFLSRSISVNLSPGATDVDPYDPSDPPSPGSPSSSPFFRVQLKFRSPRNGGTTGDSVTYVPPVLDRVNITLTNNLTLPLPDSLGGNQVRVMLELCDCPQCETVPGQGRCNYYSYVINGPPPPGPALGSVDINSGPGQAILVEKKRGER